MAEHKYTNALAKETSPYLLQHAHNPVNWYPWGEKALQKARTEDKPILLSIGYSACHWCHVMEHESFENEEIARVMNEHFINIKVDREERPDLDTIYMNFVQMSTGSGGWPMTVFLTPDQVPFYGGTYFPPDDRYGRPGFRRLLLAVADAYRNRKDEIKRSTGEILNQLRQLGAGPAIPGELTPAIFSHAYRSLAQQFDSVYGGFGDAPKFPAAMNLGFLLRYWRHTGEPHALEMVERTLQKMARGGIYDQLGGGFHRYSVDERWLVPHFEKMLYDNALLSRLYLEAYQVTGNAFYRKIVEETLDYVKREMTSPEGGFYSTQDADSEGEEGKFFLWRPDEVRTVLGDRDGDPFCKYYDVTKQGNFEGKNILNIPQDLETVASAAGIEPDALAEKLARGKRLLYEVREKRIKPGRDDKAITSWNGLMMLSFIGAAAVLERQDYLEVAQQNANFLLRHLRQGGRLLRTYKDGQSKLNGYLEDYACLVEGLLTLYQVSFDIKWLEEAQALTDVMIDQFWDASSGGFYFTSRDHENLISRTKDFYDNATPSGNSVAVFNLLRLALLTGKEDYRQKAEQTLRLLSQPMSRFAGAFGYALTALDFALDAPKEIAIVGSLDQEATQNLLRVVYKSFTNKVVALGEPQDTGSTALLPLLAGKTLVKEQSAAYVCRNYTCQEPVTDPKDLEKLLKR